MPFERVVVGDELMCFPLHLCILFFVFYVVMLCWVKLTGRGGKKWKTAASLTFYWTWSAMACRTSTRRSSHVSRAAFQFNWWGFKINKNKINNFTPPSRSLLVKEKRESFNLTPVNTKKKKNEKKGYLPKWLLAQQPRIQTIDEISRTHSWRPTSSFDDLCGCTDGWGGRRVHVADSKWCRESVGLYDSAQVFFFFFFFCVCVLCDVCPKTVHDKKTKKNVLFFFLIKKTFFFLIAILLFKLLVHFFLFWFIDIVFFFFFHWGGNQRQKKKKQPEIMQ